MTEPVKGGLRPLNVIKKMVLLLFLAGLGLAFRLSSEWQPVNYDEASKELLAVNRKMQSDKCYSFDVIYKSYKNHTTKEIHEQTAGKVSRDGINYRSDIMGKLIVQNRDLRVTVDSAAKIIKVNNAFEGVDAELGPEASAKLLASCKVVKKAQENDMTGFRFEMKEDRGIISQEIYFDAEFLRRMVYFYINDHELRVNNEIRKQVVYPRLVVDFLNFKKQKQIDKELFNTKKIVTIRKGKLVHGEQYKKYKLIDGRYNK